MRANPLDCGRTGLVPGTQAQKTAEPPVTRKECADCGVVVMVRMVERKGDGTGLGGVAGAIVGREISDGRDVGTVVGAAGGAIAGHQIERHARTTKHYEVRVRMSEGNEKSVRFATRPAWKPGDRVRLQDGKLVSV